MKNLIFAVFVYAAFPLMVILPVEGYAAEENRDLGEFERVTVGGVIELTIEFGDDTSIRVRAPDGELGNVRTQRNGNELTVGTRGDLSKNAEYRVDLVMRTLTELQADGATDVRVADFTGDSLEVEMNGAVNLQFGSLILDKFEVDANGAANLDIRQLQTGEFELDADGAANIDLGEVNVASAQVEGSGAANIKARGKMGQLDADMSGASDFMARELQVDSLTSNASMASRIRVGN